MVISWKQLAEWILPVSGHELEIYANLEAAIMLYTMEPTWLLSVGMVNTQQKNVRLILILFHALLKLLSYLVIITTLSFSVYRNLFAELPLHQLQQRQGQQLQPPILSSVSFESSFYWIIFISVVAWSGAEPEAFSTKVLDSVNSLPFKLCQNWKLTVDVQLNLWTSINWANIFGVAVADANNLTYGSRIPAVWIWYNRDNRTANELHFTYRIGDNNSYSFNLEDVAFTSNDFFSLQLSEINGIYEIRVNDVLKHSVNQTSLVDFSNVEAKIANLYNHYEFEVPSGQFKNFKLKTNCDGQ